MVEHGSTSYTAQLPDLPSCVAAAEKKAEVSALIRAELLDSFMSAFVRRSLVNLNEYRAMRKVPSASGPETVAELPRRHLEEMLAGFRVMEDRNTAGARGESTRGFSQAA